MSRTRVTALLGLVALLAVPASSALEKGAPLPAPQWVGAADERGKVRLTWIRNPDFAIVRVLRRQPERAEGFAPVGETRENSFLDATAQPGQAYAYRLVGVGADRREGKPSTDLSFRPALVAPKPLAPPAWEGHLVLEDGIGLKWSVEEGEPAIAHNIYRRSPSDPEFQLVGSSRGTSYHDMSVEAGRTYVYAITSLDASFRETPLSRELPVVFAPARAPAGEKVDEVWRVRRTRLVALVTAGDVPFVRPADVAFGPVSGSVYLADSGLDRVLVFTPQGRYLHSVGATAAGGGVFKNVLGLALDREENLYVVDAGSSAVQVFGRQGNARRRFEIPRPEDGRPTGIIDAAVGEGGRVYVIDNLNNRVSIAEAAGAPRFIGSSGRRGGEFSAPTFCDVDAAGSFYVADALNARVQVFTAAGEFVRAFGRYQRGPGGLGRPKGVAAGRSGEVYVADSWLNTVQVFDGSGRFVAVLGDEAGRPLDLGSPNGVALWAGNRVAIAERLSARLQIRELIDAP